MNDEQGLLSNYTSKETLPIAETYARALEIKRMFGDN